MITVSIDDSSLRAFLAAAGEQLPYAAMIGINRTAEDALYATHAEILAAMTIRRPQFIPPPRQLPREWRATKENPTAVIAIGDGGGKGKIGDRRRAILEKFEAGGERVMGRLPIAIPTRALRSSPTADVSQKMYPKYLLGQFNNKGELTGLGTKARTRQGNRRGRGKAVGRYFALGKSTDRNRGLYERTGPETIQKLWTFRTRVSIPPILRWEATAQRTINERLVPNMEGAIDLALRSAAEKAGRRVGRAVVKALS